jgi:hypothetical protein
MYVTSQFQCSCLAFQNEVVLHNTHLYCKHQLALILSEVLNDAQVSAREANARGAGGASAYDRFICPRSFSSHHCTVIYCARHSLDVCLSILLQCEIVSDEVFSVRLSQADAQALLSAVSHPRSYRQRQYQDDGGHHQSDSSLQHHPPMQAQYQQLQRPQHPADDGSGFFRHA